MTYVIYRFRITQIRQKANLDKLLSQSEMNALRAQMNPHFVFNSLNSIREMILNKRPSSEIRKSAIAEGMTTLRQSALAKIFAGHTTLKEINRVTFIE